MGGAGTGSVGACGLQNSLTGTCPPVCTPEGTPLKAPSFRQFTSPLEARRESGQHSQTPRVPPMPCVCLHRYTSDIGSKSFVCGFVSPVGEWSPWKPSYLLFHPWTISEDLTHSRQSAKIGRTVRCITFLEAQSQRIALKWIIRIYSSSSLGILNLCCLQTLLKI